MKTATARGRRVDDVRVVQCFDHLQAGQNAEVSVQLAAVEDRIDVRAGHDRRQILAARPDGEDIADGVDLRGQPGLSQPVEQSVAARLVLVGQGKAAHTAFGRSADRAQSLDTCQ